MGVLDVFSSLKATNLDFTKERHSPVPYPSSLLSSTACPTAPPGAGSPRSEDQNPSAQSPAAAPTSHRLPSQQPPDWPLCFSKSPFKSHHDCPELGPQTASLRLNFSGTDSKPFISPISGPFSVAPLPFHPHLPSSLPSFMSSGAGALTVSPFL